VLTLYTTPVVYLYLDRFSQWCARRWASFRGIPLSDHTPHGAV